MLKWARSKSGPVSNLFKVNHVAASAPDGGSSGVYSTNNKGQMSNKMNSGKSKKSNSGHPHPYLQHHQHSQHQHIESIPKGVSPLVKMSGVITITDLHVYNLKSSLATSMANYVHFVISFSLGRFKRNSPVSNKQVEVKFKETYNIIIGDIYQDVLTIKIKKITALGYKQVITQIDVRAKNVMNSPDQVYIVNEDLSKDKVVASGTLACKLTYRAVARIPSAVN
jgi:hypothetical protein